MKIIVVVTSKKGSHRFAALVHVVTSPNQFHMDPVEFYQEWGKSIPEGVHHELEIIEPDASLFERHVLHMHKSRKTSTPFVCYPLHIPTPERAMEVFSTWCVGTVLKIDKDVDLNTVYSQECGNDQVKFFKVVRERYEIRITEKTTLRE